MTTLLVAREYIRNFYVKYEEYAIPALKFLLALASLLMINGQLGYMGQLNKAAAVLIVALICSFMPKNFTLFVAAGFVTLHLYEVSLECAGVALAVFLLLFLLYFRFTPGETVMVLITPLLFILRIPYAAPILAGLLGNPLSAVTVACGVIVYYLVSYMSMNASLLSASAAESILVRIRKPGDGDHCRRVRGDDDPGLSGKEAVRGLFLDDRDHLRRASGYRRDPGRGSDL